MTQKHLLLGLLAIISLTLTANGQCPPNAPSGSLYFDTTRKCYYFNSTAFVSWPDARTSCLSIGGDLVSIHSDVERNFTLNYAGSSIAYAHWIGLSNYISQQTGNCSWSDNSAYDYLPSGPWQNGGNPCGGPNTCTFDHFSYAGFAPAHCTDRVGPYICEIIIPHSSVSCPNGTISSNLTNKCYEFNTTPKSWDNAQLACQAAGGELVSIHSAAENQFLTSNIFNKAVTFWIGYNREVNNALNFTWSDNSPSNYTNWNPSVPGICSNGPQKCVSVDSSGGQWFNCWPCSHALSYICELKPNGMKTSSLEQSSPNDGKDSKILHRADLRKVGKFET